MGIACNNCTRHPRASPSPHEFAFATWNVRGLTSAIKRQTLGTDCEHYNIDIACIQETKVATQSEQLLQTGHKLILMQQKESTHHGLGFVIGPRLLNHVLNYGRVNDRIATMDLSLPLRNGRTTKCRIVNVYGPTTERAQENPSLVESLYDALSTAIKVPSRWLLYVCGDFNAKLGKLNKSDKDAGLGMCMGSYGMGKRNNNGEALASFISAHGLFATNTAFKHPVRHRTSWTGHIADPNAKTDSKATIAIFNQIDFVLCKIKSKPLLRDSRTYGGADLNSDHKPVVTRIRMENIILIHKKHHRQKGQVRYDLARLTNDPTTQAQYNESLQNQLTKIDQQKDPNKALANILKCMETSAASTVGVLKNNNNCRHHTEDPLVVELSEKQKALRLRIYQHGQSEDRNNLRTERNNILRKISKRLRELEIMRADSLAKDISSTDECRKMFRAARALKTGSSIPSLSVHNADGHFVATDKGKADTISEWFKKQFTDPGGEQLDPFLGDPRPLEVPIKEEEVKRAIKTLRNGRSSGPDGISNELFKYGSNAISPVIAPIINSAFEHHHPIKALGQGTLIALPKPKKPPGPPANLRPIVLLNSIRKIMSTITLHRIRDKIDHFTGPYQSGFKRGRSCADIVWAQRMLVSVVMSKHWDFYKMGIDMSRAFDTIKRPKILEVLHQAGCNEDELRLVRILLAGTELKVRVKSTYSAEFETTIGSPQGDSLSPVLFTCYLAAALSSVRRCSTRPNPPISALGMPLEMEYADDVDFIDEEKDILDRLLPVAAQNLKDSNLFMNEAKTEFTHVYLSDTQEKEENDKPLRGKEDWRKSKILGSLLCSSSDIEARCVMGNIAFQSFWKIWIRGSKIPLTKKLQLYNATCVSIMLYNCNSWAAPKAAIDKLDACHRKHLRTITGHKWPDSLISNEALYKMCKTTPLSTKVRQLRWTMFGHVLRMPEDTPAQKALEFAIVGSSKYKARKGRHCTNLLSLLRADLKDAGLGTLRTAKKLKELRMLARNKMQWTQMKKD